MDGWMLKAMMRTEQGRRESGIENGREGRWEEETDEQLIPWRTEAMNKRRKGKHAKPLPFFSAYFGF